MFRNLSKNVCFDVGEVNLLIFEDTVMTGDEWVEYVYKNDVNLSMPVILSLMEFELELVCNVSFIACPLGAEFEVSDIVIDGIDYECTDIALNILIEKTADEPFC